MKRDAGTKIAIGVGCAALVIALSVALYTFGHARLENQRKACEANLQRMAHALSLYAQEDPEGYYPALDPTPGRLAPTWDALYPHCLTEPAILACPANPTAPVLPANPTAQEIAAMIDDHSYWYFGYVLPNEVIFQRFANVYQQEISAGRAFDSDLNDGQGSLIMRLRKGVARYFVNDRSGEASFARQVPVMMERPANHSGGGHVLYLDGHVEFIPYPGKYPMTPWVVQTLGKTDTLAPVRVAASALAVANVPEGILEAARIAKTGFVFHKLDMVMSVVSEDFASAEYRDKAGLRRHLERMKLDGDLQQPQVFFQFATYTRNADGTWTGSPFELKAVFGTATFKATLRREGEAWRVIALDVQVGSARNL